MMNLGLTNEEVRELQTQLDADEWDALRRVQRELLDAPMLSPKADFVQRTNMRLAKREHARARRHSTFGAIMFVLGVLIVIALLVWSSPLSYFFQLRGWTILFNCGMWVTGVLTTMLMVAFTFVVTLLQVLGEFPLLLFALFTLALTMVWVRVVADAAPLNRLLNTTEV